MKKVNVAAITTEGQNKKTTNIDRVSTIEKLKLINNEDKTVAKAVEKAMPEIAKAVDLAVKTIKAGGRVIYIGAGTSGRLGVLDASEMLPTYGEGSWFVGLIAGGDTALRNPIEGAEDSVELPIKDLDKIKFSSKDLLVGIAASGRTPYVVAGLKYAKKIKAKSVSISTSANAEISKHANIAIEAVVGPETVIGSTRMKSGTAQKMILNMLSTATMVSLGKTYFNWMVDVKSTNEKLENRAVAMIKKLTKTDDKTALNLFNKSERNVKVAVVMHYKKVSKSDAEKLLKKNNDFINGLI